MEQGSLAGIPIVYPTIIDAPWLIAFTAIASPVEQSIGHCFDYKVTTPAMNSKGAARETTDRARLEQALNPLRVIWLNLDHGNSVSVIPDQLSDLNLVAEENLESAPGLRHSDTIDNLTSAVVSGQEVPSTIKTTPVTAAARTTDAALVTTPGFAAALTTADCLPIIVVCPSNRVAAVIHAGWRGLARGVIENTLGQIELRLGQLPKDVVAWIGPSIQQDDFEIEDTVKLKLLENDRIGRQRFRLQPNNRYLANLQGMAADILTNLGVQRSAIEVCPLSTRSDPRLHSARRDGSASGRMATVVGILPVC